MKNVKLLLFIFALIALTLGGCQKNEILLETEGADGSLIPPDTFISIGSKETLGQWFTLDISAGEVVYTPTYYNGYNRANIPPQGVSVKSRVSRERLEEILREFENQKFFSLRDSYVQTAGGCEGGRIMDAGVRTISITSGGRKKHVEWKACQKDGKDFPPAFFAVFEKIYAVRNK